MRLADAISALRGELVEARLRAGDHPAFSYSEVELEVVASVAEAEEFGASLSAGRWGLRLLTKEERGDSVRVKLSLRVLEDSLVLPEPVATAGGDEPLRPASPKD